MLTVEEVYTMDNSDPSLPHTAKPALERTKTWKHTKKSDGLPETDNAKTKVRNKKYNTRRKRHKEGNRRRENVMEQLIDNVGLGGVLSGAFASEDDAFDKLASIQKFTYHSAWFFRETQKGALLPIFPFPSSHKN